MYFSFSDFFFYSFFFYFLNSVLYSPGDRRGVGPGALPADSSNLAVGGGVMGRTPGELRQDLHGQLSAVEKLQYQLTSHELQFAQRMAQKEQYAAEKVQISAVSSSSDSGDG